MNSMTSNVVALREHTPETALAYADAVAAARRDLDEWDRKYIEGKRVLMDKYARAAGAASGAPPVERRLSKKAAAAELGITQQNLIQIVGQHRLDHPDHLPLGFQPNGKNSNWVIFINRVEAYMSGRQTPLA